MRLQIALLNRAFERSASRKLCVIVLVCLLPSISSGQQQAADTSTINISLPPGIYYKNRKANKYIELEPSIMTNTKNGGTSEYLKRRLVSGLINAKTRATVDNPEAEVKIRTSHPLFVFVFDTTVNSFSSGNTAFVPRSPKEFVLIRMNQTEHSREIVVGKHNNISSDVGVDDKVKVEFSYKKIRKGLYEVSAIEPLDYGEYCFMAAVASMQESAGSKIYDFSRLEPLATTNK